MIARIWHGWTDRHDADSYQRLLEEEIIPGIAARGIPGVDGPVVLRRDAADNEVEFITMMTFVDTDGIEAFGGREGASVVPPAARALLRRFDEHSQHYDVVVGTLAV